jgi:hypothetical protein
MAGKNTAVFGIYRTAEQAERAVASEFISPFQGDFLWNQ